MKHIYFGKPVYNDPQHAEFVDLIDLAGQKSSAPDDSETYGIALCIFQGRYPACEENDDLVVAEGIKTRALARFLCGRIRGLLRNEARLFDGPKGDADVG